MRPSVKLDSRFLSVHETWGDRELEAIIFIQSASVRSAEKRMMLFGALAAGVLCWSTGRASAQNCPDPPVPTASSQIPADVCIPAGFSGNPIQFFDDYSWRAFIAMVWPAQDGKRGVPDPTQKLGSTSGPLVFETFKADWEVFQPVGASPSPWAMFGGVPANPCQNQIPNPGFSDMILASITKFQNLGQAGFGNLVGPLVAQNGTYVRYMTSFNESEFNQILSAKWYLRANLKGGLTFEGGSTDVKTSWIDMTNVPHPERFYARQAWLMDLQSGACSKMTVGLVGMHIVQKTTSRPQWIWSSFEHIDNVPESNPANSAQFTFNNGNREQSMPSKNPIAFPPPETPPPPFNVERVKPINRSTQKTDAAYQNVVNGTVWANYKLVMTQWPLQASQPILPGTPPNTFPGTIDQSTAFSNTTMETFDQKNVVFGCMACHNVTRGNTDFLWSLEINAFPPTPSTLVASSLGAPNQMTLNATPTSEPLRQLKALLERAVAQPK
jgi:hypothetical protein